VSDELPELTHVVYLIHFDVPIARARHYVGICRSERLALRLREHAHRRGASLTAALARRNTCLHLARLWPALSPELERTIKARGRYEHHCPICRTGSHAAALATVPCPRLVDLSAELIDISFSRQVDDPP
jgi:hypothetical protein